MIELLRIQVPGEIVTVHFLNKQVVDRVVRKDIYADTWDIGTLKKRFFNAFWEADRDFLFLAFGDQYREHIQFDQKADMEAHPDYQAALEKFLKRVL